MAITKEQVLKALSYVEDPDLGKDLVTLNMISDIVLDGKSVIYRNSDYSGLPHERCHSESMRKCHTPSG